MPRPSTIATLGPFSEKHGSVVPIAFVTETFNTETVAATTLTLTPGNTAGNLLVLCLGDRPSSATVTSVADTGGNTWTLSTGNGGLQSVYYSKTGFVSGTLTVTMSVASTLILSCLEFSGIAASPADVKGIGTAASTAPSATSGVLAHANDVLIAWVAQQINAPTFSSPTSGWTVLTQRNSVTAQPISMQAAYKIVAATTTQTYSLTSSSAVQWTEIIAAFKGN